MSVNLTYGELKEGDIFSLGCKYVETINGKIKGDKRLFRKDREGATQVVDVYGDRIINPTFKIYCYLSMPVFKEVLI